MNPTFGPLVSPEYPRFYPLGDAYSVMLRKLAFLAAHKLDFDRDALAEGTYAWVSGPAYETPAEGRFLRNAGAHVVGMSTIPEVVAAREEGLEIMVLSLVTNMVVIPNKYRSIRDEVEAEVSETPLHLVLLPTTNSLLVYRCLWPQSRLRLTKKCSRQARERRR